MPELPDITIYLEALTPRIVGQPVAGVRIISPFVLRTVDPPLESLVGQKVEALRRLGKRIVFTFPRQLYLVIHLMIAGRFRWLTRAARPPGKITLALLDFPTGTLALTEASQKKRAALHLVRGATALRVHDPGGVEVLDVDLPGFTATLRRENHTLKRALTDPRLFAGIGNAYADEILHVARLSPLALTAKLSDDDIARLHHATRTTLHFWIRKLRSELAGRFPAPGDITAFRPDFAVHGRFAQPCRTCGQPVQRIRYAENETNYCPACQTGGHVLADRSLSRLLKSDRPRALDEWETRPRATGPADA